MSVKPDHAVDEGGVGRVVQKAQVDLTLLELENGLLALEQVAVPTACGRIWGGERGIPFPPLHPQDSPSQCLSLCLLPM